MGCASNTRSGFLFRPVQRSDVETLTSLHGQLFPVRYGPSFFESLFDKGTVSIAAVEPLHGKVVGVATGSLPRGSCLPHWVPLIPREGYIMTLGVQQEFRRQGIGSYLLQEVCDLLADRLRCSRVTLHVKADNERALTFYKRNGFRVVEFLPNYYVIDRVSYDAYRLVRPAMPSRTEGRQRSALSSVWIAFCSLFLSLLSRFHRSRRHPLRQPGRWRQEHETAADIGIMESSSLLEEP